MGWETFQLSACLVDISHLHNKIDVLVLVWVWGPSKITSLTKVSFSKLETF